MPPHAATGGLTNEKFEQLIDFTDKLWRAGGYNSKPQDDGAWGVWGRGDDLQKVHLEVQESCANVP